MNIFVKDKKFYKTFFALAIPIILQSIITISINMLDTLMLGSFGDSYLSATSLSNQFYNVFQMLCMGIGSGIAVLTSQFWGREDGKSIKKTLSIMFLWVVVLSAIFTALMFICPNAVLRIYTTDESVIKDGVKYFTFLRYSFLFSGISMALSSVLRSINESKVPFKAALVGLFVNAFFNYAFIFGKFGFPRLEIVGAAIGTLIARIIECLINLYYLFVVDQKIGYRITDLKVIDFSFMPELLKFTIPVMISNLIMTLGNNALGIIMGHISKEFVAAYSITSVFQQLVSIAITGVASAAAVQTGNQIGRGNIKEAYDEGKTMIAIAFIWACFAALLIFIFKDLMIDYYNVSNETRIIANDIFMAIIATMIFQSTGQVLTKGILRGGGDTKFLMFADVLFLWILSIPTGYLAGLVWHLSSFWIYFFLKCDNIVKCIWMLIRFKSKKWIRRVQSSTD